jgi:tetratricopeptide (TPR) repeat protein
MASRSGELATRPLPAVLLDLHEEFATGKLTLKRGRVSKSVDLVNGNPVSTQSTPRDETLGHFLVQSGVITEHQHQQAVARASEMGGKLGEALVSLHVLSFQQLIEQLGKQARHKLVQALRWPQGAWRFDASESAVEGLQLRMVEVVLEGLRETAVEDLERLARLDGMTFVLTQRGENLRHELKRVFGGTPLELLGDGATIRELERAFPHRANARLAVDAMLLCDAVAAQVEERGLGASMTLPSAPPVMSLDDASHPAPELYEILFDDLSIAHEGAAPIDVIGDGDDSGIVSLEEVNKAADELDHVAAAARTVAAEHQRIQGADHYAVLMIQRRANAKEIETAASIKLSLLDRDARALADGRDVTRAAEIRDAYAAARAVLLDDRRRGSYDRELHGGELMQAPPAIDAELVFRAAEELMAKEQWAQAIGQIRTAIARAPGEADYHAALGWATWMANGCTADAAELARPHLNAALEINTDHAAAHDYKGRITAAQRLDDDEALFHLEKAIDLDPTRADAVAAIESALIARGELRRLERVLKRLLFRLRGRGTTAEAKAWARLARLYLDHLDDPHGADAAAATARRIAPRDSDVQALIKRAERSATAKEPLRAGWREALGDPHSGAALVKTTEASGHTDAAFLAASTMVALGTADAQMTAIYDAGRARSVPTTARPLGREQWGLLRHKDDGLELGALMELVAGAVHAIAPMTLADGDLDAGQRVDDLDLPASFLRLRERSSAMLGVPSPPVYSKVELGTQIHVVACDPPVLVAGDDALRAPERPDLVFRLVRAMTFLWPGRAVGASRPGRTLRAVVMAVVREASGSAVGKDDPLAEAATDAVARLPGEQRVQARAAALRLLSRGGALNLSLWARALTRTADRAGMLLCADVPAAFAGARDVGELDRDLIEFAYSAAHVQLRKQLGIARG